MKSRYFGFLTFFGRQSSFFFAATAPQSLTPDEVYAITAYLLFLNGIIAETQTMDASTLPKVEMPNRKGFVQDPRPDIVNVPCRDQCR